VVCCHGFETGFQYGASFNSLLLASPLGWGPIWASVANEFYLLDGKKFSTTRNHAVWGSELLARVPSDPVRFYLALTNPETEQTNFVLDEFRDTSDRLLTGPWNRLHERLGRALAAPGCPAGARPVPDGYAARLDKVAQEVQAALTVETFSLIRAARAVAGHLEELAARADRLPSSDERELAAVLAGLKALALFAEPILPRFAARLQDSLQQGLATDRTWGCYRRPIAPAGVRWGEDLRMKPVAALL
jgi:methionyl-tRNA synthetase